MFKLRLTAKVLIAIAVTLSIGFACLGGLSLYLSYHSMLDLQRNAARQAAADVIHDLIELKMKGDFDAFNGYVAEVVKRGAGNMAVETPLALLAAITAGAAATLPFAAAAAIRIILR